MSSSISPIEDGTCECCPDKGNGPYYTNKGCLFSKLMPRSAVEDLQKWTARNKDVFLLSYPGSGIHWLRELVWQITTDDNAVTDLSTNIATECTHLNIRQLTNEPQMTSSADESPRLISTHLPAEILPPSILTNQSKIIYLARYPKDVAVEYYQITNQHELLPRYRTWRRFYKDFRIGHVYGGSWFDHTLYWWNRRHQHNVLFIKHEELITDFEEVQSKLNAFLGCSPKNVQQSPCRCSIQTSMKNGRNPHNSSLASEGYSIYNLDWREVFRVSHNEDFDYLYKSKMVDCGLVLRSDSGIVS
ncbi:sulfotransferase 1A1-like [Amphiura filiformis]|uniref:sulfotransferase 1A1-like n=1 Tax=Amphiura filiformis TaxID=82378 RepID=UPI003B21F038